MFAATSHPPGKNASPHPPHPCPSACHSRAPVSASQTASHPPVATFFPSGEKARWWTLPPVLTSCKQWPLLASQIRKPSSFPEPIRRPSGEKASTCIQPGAACQDRYSCPLAAWKSCILPLPEPVEPEPTATRCPSGEKVAAEAPSALWRVTSSWDVCTSQIRMGALTDRWRIR